MNDPELSPLDTEQLAGPARDWSDTELLDWLQSKLGSYTGKACCRWSGIGRGWRLHESDADGAVTSVRQAIIDFINREEGADAEY